MIEINLLPQSLQKKRIEIPRIKFIPVLIKLVALILSIQLILTVTLGVKKYSLKNLKTKWITIEPERGQILAIKEQIDNLDNKIIKIEALKEGRILWARKLNELSDSVIPGIWFSRLSMEEGIEKKYLSIEGNVSSFGKDEAATVGRFMKILKENKSFFKDFNEIKLETIQQSKIKNIEMMHFSINCYLKPAYGQAAGTKK